MKHLAAVVAERRALGPAVWELALHVPCLGGWTPGQGCLAATPTYLRRPLFPACPAPERLSILIRAGADAGLAWLAARAPGDPLDLAGPFGRGFAAPGRGEHWLVIAETAADMGPLRQQIARAVAAGAEVVLLTGGSHAAAVFPAAELPAAVEVRVATADGSLGKRGGVIGLLGDVLPWADRLAAVGSRSLYRALQPAVHTTHPMWKRENAEVLVGDVPLVCGVGACLACAIHGRNGVSLLCQNGPVLPLDNALDAEAG